MKTNTVTITVFPALKEINTPVYLGGISYKEIFENHFVSETYVDDREKLESTVTKLIDAGLNGIKGRSAAKTKIEKTNYLLEHGYGYYYNSEGKITRKGSELPSECDFYGYVTEPATQPATKLATPIAVDRVVEVNLPYMDRTVASWWNVRNTDSDKVSVVGDSRDPAETTYYCCYGSDALKIASATNYKTTDIRMGDKSIPVFTLRKSDTRMLTETLKAAGITLKVWF